MSHKNIQDDDATPLAFENIELSDVIDAPAIQEMMNDYYALTGIGIGIIDLKGNVLVGTGWQDICVKFHRAVPESYKLCYECDTALSSGVTPGTFKTYRCKNNMWDMATPIMLGDTHIGNIFLGQFLYDDEVPDYALFRAQAKRFGYDETAYIAALDTVSRFSRQTVQTAMSFYSKLAQMISKSNYNNIVLAQTLTKRKQAEATLRDSEEKYRLLVNNLSSGVVVHAPDSSIIFSNPMASSLLGLTMDQMRGKEAMDPAWCFLRENGMALPLAEYPVSRVLSSGEPIANQVLGIRRPDLAEPVWVQCNAYPVSAADGTLLQVVVTFSDITGLKVYEKELQQKNAELERFTYTVSHDLKSPIITIKGFTGSLEKDLAKGNYERMTGDLKRVSDAADRMNDLLRDLLELSTIGRIIKAPEMVDMNLLMADVLAQLAGPLKHRNLTVAVQTGLPEVFCDRRRMAEVVQNLLENAINYMGDQADPQIRIGMREEAGENIFFVQDNGIGIEEKFQRIIFGLFNKLDAESSGTGIGLALVKRIVEVHGGRVWVESEGEGTGSRFCFTINEAQQ